MIVGVIMNELQIFENAEFGQVRTVTILILVVLIQKNQKSCCSINRQI